MKVFDEAFWNSTKLHLLASGVWPFNKPLYNTIITCIVFFFVESIMILEIIRLFYVLGDLVMTLTILPILLYVAVIQIAVLSNHINLNKTKDLLLSVKSFWESNLLDDLEIELLRKDGRQHRDKMNAYYVFYYSQPIIYGLSTLPPFIMDITSPLNTTREKYFIYATNYGVDPQQYPVLIIIHHFLALAVHSWAFVAFKANYCTLLQHACSVFTIIGLRLRTLGDGMDLINPNHVKNKLIKSISISVKMHQEILDFVFQLEDCYSTFLLLVLALNAVGLSTIGFRFVVLIGNLESNIQCLANLIGQITYIYYLSIFGQRLIDHSQYVFESICAAKPYNFPREMKPMVVLLMMRSTIPTKITAGKLFVMSQMNFASVIKTSFTYCTVLLSLQ